MNAPRPSFLELIEFRREWRIYHERQDRAGADRLFHQARIEDLSEKDLSDFSTEFRLKLKEFGRDWERAIAAQAYREKFAFYRLPLSIAVEKVTLLHEWVEQAFASNGVALFFESTNANALKNGVWSSILYLCLKPNQKPESLGFAHAPGVQNIGKVEQIV